jgi:PAS domain S-box-containing protein
MKSATPEVDSAPLIQVLVVEDERVVARDIKACLEHLGFKVVGIAASGVEAIEKAKTLLPNIILMDIRLEGEMDGTQAAQQIWQQLQIPIIYSTGYSDQATVDRATATEPFGYILKPIKERDLYVAIKTALQRHGLETRLKEREQWLTTILKGIADGVIVVDAQGQVRFLNLAAEVLTGWQQHEACNQPISKIFTPLDEQTQVPIFDLVTEVLQTGQPVQLIEPLLLVSKNGKTTPVADSIAPFRDEQGTITGAVVVFRDFTPHRLAQEQALTLQRAQLLEHQMKEMQRLNQLKDSFLSTISHELRTPLANIKMAIEMLEISLNQPEKLKADVDLTSEQIARYCKILRDQCNQELSLVGDLLEMQHLDAETTPLEWFATQLQDWVPQVIEVFQNRAARQQQQLQAIIPPDLPLLTTDVSVLSRIFTELLTNACKYTPSGGEITVTAYVHQEDWIRLQVSNTGVEVPADELSRVFDKFYRIPTSDPWKQSGTGLGLALLKKLVTYAGGSIWAESGSDQTHFIVELPINPLDKTQGYSRYPSPA